MIKKIVLAVIVILGVMQFVRPDKNESGYESVAFFEKETQPTKEMQELLRNKCYDCHSNQTNYPWYAEIAPISFCFLVASSQPTTCFVVQFFPSYRFLALLFSRRIGKQGCL